MMHNKLLSIAAEPASFQYESEDLLSFMDDFITDPIALRKLKFIWKEAGIKTKYSALPDFKKVEDPILFKTANDSPSTSNRLKVFDAAAPVLAEKVCRQAIIDANIGIEDIDAIVAVSCTGMSAPGLEIQLAQKLGLRPNIDRHAINFMGCYAAFHGLRLADMICNQAKGKSVLVVCVELCSLHFRNESSDDNLLSTALFSDGSAAFVVGSDDTAGGMASITSFHSELIEGGKNDMTWNIGGSGFEMSLNRNVPKHIQANMAEAFANSLKKSGMSRQEVGQFAIHPGGKNVLTAFAKALGVGDGDLWASFKILENFGNMSSASVMFVLKELLETSDSKEAIYTAAFGPGLTIESALLKPIVV